MEPTAVHNFGSPMVLDRRPDQSGEQHAPGMLDKDAIESHMRRMFRLIYGIVRNVPDAQDLTQESMVKALTRRSQLKDDRKAKQWLNRIAVNTALDFVRKRSRITFGVQYESPPETAESPEQRVLRGETRSWLEGGLELLSARERTALVLRDVENMPASEVASLMGCSPATVRSHIANARVKFRKYREGHRL